MEGGRILSPSPIFSSARSVETEEVVTGFGGTDAASTA